MSKKVTKIIQTVGEKNHFSDEYALSCHKVKEIKQTIEKTSRSNDHNIITVLFVFILHKYINFEITVCVWGGGHAILGEK